MLRFSTELLNVQALDPIGQINAVLPQHESLAVLSQHVVQLTRGCEAATG